MPHSSLPRALTVLLVMAAILLISMGFAVTVDAAPKDGALSTGRPRVDAIARHFRVMSWPLPGRPVVLRRFLAPQHHYGPGHRGVDLAAAPGMAVLAAHSGFVQHAGPVAGRGVISVRHANGLVTTYEPVTAMVRQGQYVRRKEQLGIIEADHAECPAVNNFCLHWGVREGASYRDPLSLLQRYRVRLLPLTPTKTAHT